MTDIFTAEERKALIMARLAGDDLANGGGVTQGDLELFVGWCRKVQIDAALVGLFLSGRAMCLTQHDDGAPGDIRMIEAQAQS